MMRARIIRKAPVVATALAVALCGMPLAGCGSNGATAQTADSAATTEPATTVAATTEQESAEPIPVNVGETFTIPDMFEVTINSFEWLDEVTLYDGFITAGVHRDGATYFVVRASVKNISDTAMMVGSGAVGNLSGRYKFNDKYEVDADMVFEVENGESYDVEPLMTSDLIIYGAVSNEIMNQFEFCDLYLTTNEIGEDGVWYLDQANYDAYVARLQ